MAINFQSDELQANKYIRKIRSFVRREGRLTPGQSKALTHHWPSFGLELADGVCDFNQAFGRDNPKVLEIGFGMGGSLLEMASAQPEIDFIGIEVHRPGVGTLLMKMHEHQVDNIRIYCDDAVEVLTDCVADNSLDKIQIFFPDPWHKKKHHKRRLIQVAFVELLLAKLKPRGMLHLATDWENYAEHMIEVLAQVPSFRNLAGESLYVDRPKDRPFTKYEQRGQRLGHGVWDMMFEK